ncbi:hypothetical protein J4Q44_G00284510 [Coregonus suidteri]|uniref:Uncharacterized protein n=1 Tax=Coregonus suidteri TaxID=861788 RepID=A0AAN8KYE8_9TELE
MTHTRTFLPCHEAQAQQELLRARLASSQRFGLPPLHSEFKIWVKRCEACLDILTNREVGERTLVPLRVQCVCEPLDPVSETVARPTGG